MYLITSRFAVSAIVYRVQVMNEIWLDSVQAGCFKRLEFCALLLFDVSDSGPQNDLNDDDQHGFSM